METSLAILDLFAQWSSQVTALTDSGPRRGFFRQELPGLLRDKSLLEPVLESVAQGAPYPDVGLATMFDSEIVLYRDPARMFSVRLYLWGPDEHDPIHDHNSWGVIGTVLGTLDVINYRRLDDPAQERHAVLQECSRLSVHAGETCPVFPLDKGIHRTGNAGGQAVIQVGVYGENLTGRDHVNIFDPVTGEISRLYLPPVKKRMLAGLALTGLSADKGQ
jgi:hypothetical protein